MTRGKFVLFEEDKVYATNEFNGDMYYSGHGELAALGMKGVRTKEALLEYAKDFNKKEFGYPEEEICLYLLADEETYDKYLDMTQSYFEKYFSDYIYIINVSGRDLEFKTKSGTRILRDDTSGVLNFGTEAEEFPSELDGFKQTASYRKLKDNEEKIKETAVLQKVSLTDNDVKEAVAIMESHGYSAVTAIYNSLREYAEEEVAELVDKWVLNYFNFDKYIKNVDYEEQGVFEVNSGKTFVFF